MRSHTGLLVMSYGTPRGLDDVAAFYTHIRGGRPPSPEFLADLTARYTAIGGRSPLIEITESLARCLEDELNRDRGTEFRVVHGMKHQRPFIEDAVSALASGGAATGIGLVLAPHYSAMNTGEYLARAGRAAAEAALPMTFVRHWHDHPRVLDLITGRVLAARQALRSREREGTPVVFTAHSLPARILASGDPYPAQVRQTADAIAGIVGLERWLIAWQSAGRTGQEWLGPDLGTVLRRLAAEGHRAVIVCPVGFVADHLEVLYDVDIDARRVACQAGLRLVRTRSLNDDPEFAAALAAIVRDHLAANPLIAEESPAGTSPGRDAGSRHGLGAGR
jgi:ferrochelatase